MIQVNISLSLVIAERMESVWIVTRLEHASVNPILINLPLSDTCMCVCYARTILCVL